MHGYAYVVFVCVQCVHVYILYTCSCICESSQCTCRRRADSTPISSTTILHYWWVTFSLNLELTSLDRLGPCKPLGLAWLCLPKAGAGLFMGRYVWLCMQIMRIWTRIFPCLQKRIVLTEPSPHSKKWAIHGSLGSKIWSVHNYFMPGLILKKCIQNYLVDFVNDHTYCCFQNFSKKMQTWWLFTS